MQPLCAGLDVYREKLLKYFVVTLLITALAAPVIAVPATANAENFTQYHILPNGCTVNIYTPELILEKMTSRDAVGNLVFTPEGGGYYFLIEDVDDPEISNKGAGEFFPMNPDYVLEALREIGVGGRRLEMHLDIYVLPMPRSGIMSSSTNGKQVFLSPGVWEISGTTTATVVTHEFGHCYQKFYLPVGSGDEWTGYLSMRGILEDPAYSEVAAHMFRPSEIFAEDFRVLFGGYLAANSAAVENPYLVQPGEVIGLKEFIASTAGEPVLAYVKPGDNVIASIGNYPNPFNPVTTIRAEFSGMIDRGDVSVRIYAADGSLVRDLWSGTFTGDSIERDWDGFNRQGAPATSGVYFYRITAGTDVRTGKMLLVR